MKIVLLHNTQFNMPITLLPSLILFSISKVVAPVASRMDPRYPRDKSDIWIFKEYWFVGAPNY
jgi:hypothetical protein